MKALTVMAIIRALLRSIRSESDSFKQDTNSQVQPFDGIIKGSLPEGGADHRSPFVNNPTLE